MTTALDLTIPGAVKTLLASLGAAATLTPKPGPYVVATASADISRATPTSVKCTPPSPDRKDYGPDSTGVAATLTTYLAADGLALEPEPGQTLTIAGEAFVVVGVERIKSGDLVAAWALKLTGP